MQRALPIAEVPGQSIGQAKLEHFAIAGLPVEIIAKVLEGKCMDCLGNKSIGNEHHALSDMCVDHRVEMRAETEYTCATRLHAFGAYYTQIGSEKPQKGY